MAVGMYYTPHEVIFNHATQYMCVCVIYVIYVFLYEFLKWTNL